MSFTWICLSGITELHSCACCLSPCASPSEQKIQDQEAHCRSCWSQMWPSQRSQAWPCDISFLHVSFGSFSGHAYRDSLVDALFVHTLSGALLIRTPNSRSRALLTCHYCKYTP